MQQTSAYYTDKGAREKNEDSIRWFECDDEQSKKLIQIAVVSDGLGGHGAGEEASKLAVETIETCFRLNPECSEENIQKIIKAAHQNIKNLHTEEKHCKATIVAAFISKEEIVVAHSGDSRCYVFGAFGISHVTRDHSVSQMAVDVGQMKPEEIRTSPDRNKILHCLGGDDFKVDIQVIKKKVFPTKGILLCTDGFWQNVLEKEMIHTLRKSRDAKEWMTKMLEILNAKADEKQDNYSAIAIMNK